MFGLTPLCARLTAIRFDSFNTSSVSYLRCSSLSPAGCPGPFADPGRRSTQNCHGAHHLPARGILVPRVWPGSRHSAWLSVVATRLRRPGSAPGSARHRLAEKVDRLPWSLRQQKRRAGIGSIAGRTGLPVHPFAAPSHQRLTCPCDQALLRTRQPPGRHALRRPASRDPSPR